MISCNSVSAKIKSSSPGHLTVNVRTFKDEDLNTFLDCSEQIRQIANSKTRKTCEEIFECSSVDEVASVKAAEDDLQTLNNSSSINLLLSTEDLSTIFEEDTISQASTDSSMDKSKLETENPTLASAAKTPITPKIEQYERESENSSSMTEQVEEIIPADNNLNNKHCSMKMIAQKPLPKARTQFLVPSDPLGNSDLKPVPSPLPRRKNLINTNNEEAFEQLSVKQRALRLNEFLESFKNKNNVSFCGTLDRDQSNNPIDCNEKISKEIQGRVKSLARKLEEKMLFPKQTISNYTLPKNLINAETVKTKDMALAEEEVPKNISPIEEVDQDEKLHVSSLTVVLKPDTSPIKSVVATRKLLFKKRGSVTLETGPSSNVKRKRSEIETSFTANMFAPPRKIRRYIADFKLPNIILYCEELKRLFYEMTTAKNNFVSVSKYLASEDQKPDVALTSESTEVTESCSTSEDEVNRVKIFSEFPAEKSEQIIPKYMTEEWLFQQPMQRESSTQKSESGNEESESSLSTMPKMTSDESQSESQDKEIQLLKLIKPPRRRHRTLIEKDNLIALKLPAFSSDSESDDQNQIAQYHPAAKPKRPSNFAKKLSFQNNSPQKKELNTSQNQDLNFNGIQCFFSTPRKIKSAYTLTIMTSPSAYTESDPCDSEVPPLTPPLNQEYSRWCSCPSLTKTIIEGNVDEAISGKIPQAAASKSNSIELNKGSNLKRCEWRLLRNSFDDQGFETGSNDDKSPIRLERRAQELKSPSSEVLNKLQLHLRSLGLGLNSSNNPSIVSTRQNGALKVPGVDATFNSRQIKDDQQKQPTDLRQSDNLFWSSSHLFSASKNPVTQKPTSSSFWFSSGDFRVSTKIFYNTPDRLHLLHDILSQKSFESDSSVYFGIDEVQYSAACDTIIKQEMLKRLPKVHGSSQYWIATADMAVSFRGNYLPQEKIKALFQFIRESATHGDLRFGVDSVEFSKLPDQHQKYANESNSCILFGLNFSNNCVEKRGTLPSATQSLRSSKTSDLDPSEYDPSDEGGGRLSFSPSGSELISLNSEDLT